jgi:hypothetical protein
MEQLPSFLFITGQRRKIKLSVESHERNVSIDQKRQVGITEDKRSDSLHSWAQVGFKEAAS